MKAVVVHVDPSDGSLKISVSHNLVLPPGALDVLRLEPNQLAALSENELAGRFTGTVLGLLKTMYGPSFQPPHDYASYGQRP